MAGIGVLGFVLAEMRRPDGVILLSIMVEWLAGWWAASLVSKRTGASRIKSIVFCCMAYPLVPLCAIYLTWLVAWCARSFPEGSYFDTPGALEFVVPGLRLLTQLLFLGLVPVVLTLFVLGFTGLCFLLVPGPPMPEKTLSEKQKSRKEDAVILLALLVSVFAWLVIPFSFSEPFRWFLD
jgi:hypothetical protein